MNKFLLGLTLLALCSLSVAAASDTAGANQLRAAAERTESNAAQVMPITDAATATCAFTFTSGANDSFLKFCVTSNGNVVQMETPLGHEHIKHGVPGEGYGLCDTNTNTEYFDYSFFGDSPNWGVPTVVSQAPSNVRIARTTLDGIWTLIQTFTQVPGTSPSVRVTMAVRNNSTIDRTVFLMRYVDADPNHVFDSPMGATSNSAFAWDQTVLANIGLRGNFGLMLQGDALAQQHFPDLGPQAFIESNTFSDPPPPCNPYKNFVSGTPLPDGKAWLVVIYELGVPPKSSKTVTVNYKGL